MDKIPSWATRTVRTPENMEKTSDDPCCVVLIDLLGSIRLNLASGIVRNALLLHLDFQFHPYKLAVVQQLKPEDYSQRLNFSHEMEDEETSSEMHQ
ncbi:hypothetical protein AVEN_102832-1 [Araneus ventricosus]|uniref:Uncharacterized protein n=1 Tax=Araneus ventricosus TaxID=182803 RepID=A0A4Y1ZUK6_ARAVE|nr:hypothetical protein AVEN_102832-1 [Araneus ventricosus]